MTRIINRSRCCLISIVTFTGLIMHGLSMSDVNATELGKELLTGGVPQASSQADDQTYIRTILIRPKTATRTLSSPLFPSRERIQNGAAAPIFLRQNFEATHQMKVFRENYKRKDFEVELSDLDVAAIRHGTPLQLGELRRAAFRSHAGWEYPLQEEPVGFILLPDVAESRLYSTALVSSARADIREGKLADAADKICIALGLARHVGETPFMLCKLVQKAQVDRVLFAVEELMQHPAGENQFWALSSLPRPMVPILDALQMEAATIAKTFPALAKPDSRLSEDEWAQTAEEAQTFLRWGDESGMLPQPNTAESAKWFAADWAARSRKKLPDLRPEWKEKIRNMCDAEVGLRYWYERCKSIIDRQIAPATLEYSLAIPLLAAEEEAFHDEVADESVVRLSTTSLLTSWLGLVRSIAFLDQRIALLRGIESIRDWSSKHDGKLPKSLDELDLPVSTDCVTNLPFSYSRAADGKSATLHGTVLSWENRTADGKKTPVRFGYRYELRLVE